MHVATVLAFALSLLVQVSYPLAVTLWYRRRTRASWQLFFYGALVFALFQLFSWLPLSVYLDMVVGEHLSSETGAFLWLLGMALFTSLVEEGGRWWGYRYLFPRGGFRLNWRNGVMFGLGHASTETMLFLAGLTFVSLLAYLALGRMDLDAFLRSTDPSTSRAFREAVRELLSTSWQQPLIVAWERVLALPHQIAWALLVMQSLVSGQRRWFIFAVLYHASIAIIVPGMARLLGFLPAEGVNALFGLASVGIILILRSTLLEAHWQGYRRA
ncbi:MAG: YhfC family intramembrane metalloprotease [Anaerolineae bacterium]|nr:YhfC family intramembrane metalloprotease [Anaerolineae bacterium]